MSISSRATSGADRLSSELRGGSAPQLLDSLAPRRILIYRTDHLGDLILFSGALKHIRRRWPSAHISLAVHSFGRQLLANCPYVDSFVPCEELEPPLKMLRALPGLYWPVKKVRTWMSKRPGSPYARLRPSLDCDLAMLPMLAPSRHNHAVMDLIPATVRIGIRGNLNNQKSWTDLACRNTYSAQMDAAGFARDIPELEVNRLFLKYLGIDAPPNQLWPEFWTAPEDSAIAKKLMGRSGTRLVLGIAPGVSTPKGKQLPAEWYAAGLEGVDLAGFEIVLLGGKADAPICNELAALLRQRTSAGSVLNLAGQTSILQLIECIRLCDAFICPDAAPLHIATALRKPVVGIVGGGHFSRFYPWGDPESAHVVKKTMDCYGCNWVCKYEVMKCIQEIPPRDAAAALRDLIAKLRPRSQVRQAGLGVGLGDVFDGAQA
jgi:ADP-heptose:LPS heptosyltransferase